MLNSLFPRFARFTLESLLLLASHLSALLYDLEFSQRGGGGEGGEGKKGGEREERKETALHN